MKTGDINVVSLKSAASTTIDKNLIKMSSQFLLEATVKGVGQFMFVDTLVGGGLVILGIGISSRSGALAAWTGAFVACLTCYYLLQVPESSLMAVRTGLFGYNSAGACASIAGGVFFRIGPKTAIFGVFAAATAVLLLMAFRSFFGELWGLPVLTFPFITSTWVIILTEASTVLEPKRAVDIIDEIFYFFWLKMKKIAKGDVMSGNNTEDYVFSWQKDSKSDSIEDLELSGHGSSVHSVVSASFQEGGEKISYII